jgi:hypothetical protein
MKLDVCYVMIKIIDQSAQDAKGKKKRLKKNPPADSGELDVYAKIALKRIKKKGEL